KTMKTPYRFRLFLAAFGAAAIVFALLISYKTPVSNADTSGKRQIKLQRLPGAGKFVVAEKAGKASCRNATSEEAEELFRRSSELQLKPISPIRPNQTGGLKIILMGTTQLDKFPDAKAAFIRAAATWEALVAPPVTGSPITIIINVDF